MNGQKSDAATNQFSTSGSFYTTLFHDVLDAIKLVEINETQSSKRALIRAMFAGIDGALWVYKEDVRAIAIETLNIQPVEDLALSEFDYSVSDNGIVKTKRRFMPMTASLKLICRLAKRIVPELRFDFTEQGWSDLKQAAMIRNRVTHPKNAMDMEVSDEDLTTSWSGFFWLLKLGEQLMEATKQASEQFVSQVRQTLNELKNGDAKTLAYYEAAMKSLED